MYDNQIKFFETLENIFVGAEVEGKGGFIRLMRIKSTYYENIKKQLNDDIYDALEKHPERFREEMFDKLYSFFSRYFTQNGSIHFNDTAFHNNVYEKIYTNEQDVALFWKTNMLYYVKTDSLFYSMPVTVDGFQFSFNAKSIEHKKNNEKKELLFEFDKIEKDKNDHYVTYLDVKYREGNGGTDYESIVKKCDIISWSDFNADLIKKACHIFERQSKIDYFINKNAKEFLQEQFKLWSYQYFWEGTEEWDTKRISELQTLKDIAFKIIGFISQFEDELVRIWNKPKFVRKSNYVITLDKIQDSNLLKKIQSHSGYKEQKAEWQALGIDESNPQSKLPIDTQFFKDLEIEILAQFSNLDEALDGYLIKSENYQALNTILPKFREKIQTIYIDPPFNTGNDFSYTDKFQDSTWLSLIENRLEIAKEFLDEKGNLFLHLDYNANFYSRLLLDDIFGSKNFINEIIWRKRAGGGNDSKFIANEHDNINFYARNIDKLFTNGITRELAKYKKDKDGYYLEKPLNDTSLTDSAGLHYDIILPNGVILQGEKHQWKVSEDTYKKYLKNGWILYKNEKIYYKHYIDINKDLLPVSIFYQEGFNASGTKELKELNLYGKDSGKPTVKPEKVINKLMYIASEKRNYVMDFFLGYGTTTAVAHKLNRRWIGVETGEHFYSVVLPRMKKVLAYDKSGISKDAKDYKGGGFFKYYELEQYEEALNKCDYKDGGLFSPSNSSIYEKYLFLPDEKMLKAIEIEKENHTIQTNLNKLYPDIDIAETLSNLTGKPIRSISNEKVVFADGSEIDIKNLDYQQILPLIWWERE